MQTTHMDYLSPFTSELKEENLIPYRTNTKLKRKIDYLFRHAKHIYREQFISVSTSGSRYLIEDMSIRAVGMVRHFFLYPQQYNHKLDNIHFQIIHRMWKQLFKHTMLQGKEPDKYYATKLKLLSIENGLLEELIRTVEEEDYIQHSDNMIKVRKVRDSNGFMRTVGARDTIGVSEKNLAYYDSLT